MQLLTQSYENGVLHLDVHKAGCSAAPRVPRHIMSVARHAHATQCSLLRQLDSCGQVWEGCASRPAATPGDWLQGLVVWLETLVSKGRL